MGWFKLSGRKVFDMVLLVLSALLVAAKTVSESYRIVECEDKTE